MSIEGLLLRKFKVDSEGKKIGDFEDIYIGYLAADEMIHPLGIRITTSPAHENKHTRIEPQDGEEFNVTHAQRMDFIDFNHNTGSFESAIPLEGMFILTVRRRGTDTCLHIEGDNISCSQEIILPN